ncbi:uncharacterized protein B0J16DRAFT_167470 [Fusarium flagelliforme]|uniref:uncharacterized protein n=1 Tax=Fusarium flagelliforme TaxID=2675880 RepID=UPI001E8E21AA|nr:uncharacterized protein B0J16DRAFT_167470 [Fusarium flagelliforme]KAH7179191.1 hypothetical protein B0J16DRAFT_167470 [Fusarium flagelliforme]
MACCLFSLKILLLTYDSTLTRDEESTDKTYGSRNPTVDRVDHTHDQAHYSTIVVTLVGQGASGQNSITCIAGQKLRRMAANFEEGTGTVYAYVCSCIHGVGECQRVSRPLVTSHQVLF